MKTISASLLLAGLLYLAAGCATDSMTDRVIEVSVAQKDSSGPDGLSATDALNLFNDVAGRLHTLGIANPPHHYPAPADRTRVEYAVSFVAFGGYSVDITMDATGSHVIFRGETDVDPTSIAAMQKSMKLFQDALYGRRIKCQVRTFTVHLYMIPS